MRLLVLLAVVLAPARSDSEAVYKALDAYLETGDAAAAKQAFERVKLTPAKLAEAIRAGRPVENGKTGRHEWKLKDAYGRETDLYVVVPKGYDRSKPAGVIVLLHGLGGNGTQLLGDSRGGLYTAFAEGNNLILLAPTAQKEPADAKSEDDPSGLVGNNMKHWWCYRPGGFVFRGLRELKKQYAVDDDRVILSGYSMGGFGTWNLGLRYPDRFAALVPFAGGISRGEYVLAKGDKKLRPLVENGKNVPCYFVHGDKDDTVYVKFDRMTRDQLKEFGADFEYVEVPGGRHILDVREGGELMAPIQKWLAPKRRNAHPRRITYVSVGDYAAGAFWARMEGKVEPLARFEAEAKEGNVIEVKAAGAAKMTIFLDETLVDFSKPVTVKSGGKEVFKGVVEESVDAVLESWKWREDRGLVYRAKVTVELR
jgi:predicted esterase